MGATIKEKLTIENLKEVVGKILRSKVFHIILLALFSYGLTVISLYYSTGSFGDDMFVSYFQKPLIVFLNFLPILFVSLFIYILTRRVSIAYGITAIVTYLITFVNYFKLSLRDDNLLMEDLTLIKEALKMQTNYTLDISKKMIFIWCISIIITALLYFIIDRKLVHREITKIKLILQKILIIVIFIVLGVVGLNKIYVNRDIYDKIVNRVNDFNIWMAVNQYTSRGTIYSFLHSYTEIKKKVPDGYNKKEAKQKIYSYEYSNIDDDKKVNIIGIMLEAYNDFSKFDEIEFQNDPYEILHKIEKESYSGELVTNIFAGGTIDTERKFLTGYVQLPNFRSKTNSYVRYLREQGYTVEGSHPAYKWFYNRIAVSENLGFENYYFYENRYGSLANGGIANDDILMSDIFNLYKEHKAKKDNPYFSFSVTYQNHGPYALDAQYTKEYVKRKSNYTDEEYNILNNYFTGIENTNEELLELVENIKKQDEPIVLVFFGDHNPWLGNGNSVYNMLDINFELDKEEGAYNYYGTPYVIFANNEAKKVLKNDFTGEGERISPTFLMNKLFELAGYDGNEFMKASNELKEKFQVINSEFYVCDNKFKNTLTAEEEKILNDFYKVQYYWIYDDKK